MKLITLSALAAAGMMLSAPTLADQTLAKKSGCTNCHAANMKIVGPSFQDIAKKYAGDAGAEAKLDDKVKKGGSGAWGAVPMPANGQVKDEDIKTLVKWILAGAK